MSDIKKVIHRRGGWWDELGFSFHGTRLTTRHERVIEQAALEVLAAHPPVGFAGDAEGGTLTASQLAERIEQAVDAAEQAAERQREADAEERRRLGWAKVEEALSAPDADQPVVEGGWAGFTRGDATAWCWNLFQYEPRGFVHPNSQVRIEAMQKLRAGELPDVFGYPERARKHEARGLTPREYRQHKEALGADTFTSADVKHS